MKLRFTPEAAACVRRLHPDVKRHVRRSLKSLRQHPLEGHVLQLELAGLRSLRSGHYRIVYRIGDKPQVIEVLYVGPRRDVYENTRDLLASRD